jgi:hypothetical protein
VVAASAVAGALALAGWVTVNGQNGGEPGAPAYAPAAQPAPAPPPAPPVTPAPADLPLAPLSSIPPDPTDPNAGDRAQEAVRSSASGADVGVAVFDRSRGTMLASADTSEQFPCMSVVKLFIAVDALDHAPGGQVDPDTADQLRTMLSRSDDQIASALWSANGGPAIIDRTSQRLGLTGTQPPPRNPSEWGDTLTTAQDMVTLYRHITDQMPQPARDLVVQSLAQTTPTATDGFDQHFGIPTGLSGLPWAVKQGWGTSGSEAAMDSTGLVGQDSRYAVVLLSKSSASSYRSLTDGVTAAARSLSGPLGAPPQ